MTSSHCSCYFQLTETPVWVTLEMKVVSSYEGQKMISVSSDTQVHLNCFWQTISFLLHDFFYLLLKSAEGILLCVVMKMLVGYRTVYV